MGTRQNDSRGRFTARVGRFVGRRRFIAAGTSLSAALIAGCASDQSPTTESDDDDASADEETNESVDEETDESTDEETDASADEEPDESASSEDGENFRLLVSDMPADIGDFDRLDITFESARIFDGGGESPDESDDEPPETDDAGDGVERRRGFYVLDLEGETVDLTQLIGAKATSVFGGGLSEGTYEKIELHVAEVEGIVDGERVEVKVPSEKLQITHSFEIGADEPIDFVFDINVVKRGPNNGYILKPVISESGVAGKDVDVEEVDAEEADAGDAGDEGDDRADGE